MARATSWTSSTSRPGRITRSSCRGVSPEAAGGRWKGGGRTDPFVTRVQGFVPALPGEAIVIRHEHEGAHLAAHLVVGGGELLEMEGPGRPGSRERVRFYVARARGR